MEIEELNAEVDRLPQSIGLKNSGTDSELPQALPKTYKFGFTGRAPTIKYMVPRPVSTTPNIAIMSTGGQREEEKDKERQSRDKELLERWPRVDGDTELRLLYEGAIPRALYFLYY